jgi:hypothetical protein
VVTTVDGRRTTWRRWSDTQVIAILLVFSTASAALVFLGAAALVSVPLLGLLVTSGKRLPVHLRFGILIGLLTLAGINALPGPNLSTMHIKRNLNGQDLAVVGLIATLAVENLRHRLDGFGDRSFVRLLASACLLIVAWWLWELLNTQTRFTEPIIETANTGRQYLAFGLLVPLFAGTMRRAEVRGAVLAVVGFVGAIDALAYVVASATEQPLSLFLHATGVGRLNGLARVYSPEEDLFSAMLPFGLGAVLFAHRRAILVAGSGVALLALAAVLAEQTRAQYIASFLGLALALLLYLFRPGTRRAWRRLGIASGTLVTVTSLLLVMAPGGVANHVLGNAVSRVGSVGSALSSQNTAVSTVAVRQVESGLIEQRLTGHLVVGLGFPDPSYSYDIQLVGGSLQNTDVGAINVVATMGIVGAVLYYGPLAIVFGGLLLSLRDPVEPILSFGALAWLVSAAIGSITLVTLFSSTGVVVSAAAIGTAGALSLPKRRAVAPLRFGIAR